MKTTLLFLCLFTCMGVQSQFTSSPYTKKQLVNYVDTVKFKTSYPVDKKNGELSTYILSNILIWDVSDDNSTYVSGNMLCLLNIKGWMKDGKRSGLFTTYVIDSADHSKRYKVEEQTFKDDQLDGPWTSYSLKGNRAALILYDKGELAGYERRYWIDGETLMAERQCKGAKLEDCTTKEFYPSGVVEKEFHFMNGTLQGLSKTFYPTGVIKSDVFFKDGVIEGLSHYYYPNGKVWIQERYQNGLPWEILGNYDINGRSREKGTLKNGNGTVYLYNDDGSLREIITYINGKKKE